MRALAALLLVALALAGCSGSPDPEAQPTDQAADAAPETAGDAPMAAPMELTIMMQGNAFEPAEATVMVGGTVTWHTMDVQRHNVVSQTPGQEFRSSDVSSLNVPNAMPDTYQRTFEAAGDVEYECEYHPGMTGVLHVVA